MVSSVTADEAAADFMRDMARMGEGAVARIAGQDPRTGKQEVDLVARGGPKRDCTQSLVHHPAYEEMALTESWDAMVEGLCVTHKLLGRAQREAWQHYVCLRRRLTNKSVQDVSAVASPTLSGPSS